MCVSACGVRVCGLADAWVVCGLPTCVYVHVVACLPHRRVLEDPQFPCQNRMAYEEHGWVCVWCAGVRLADACVVCGLPTCVCVWVCVCAWGASSSDT